MVVVLEKGQGSKKCTCSNCSSVLSYMPSERRQKNVNHDYLGDFDTINVIQCPVCGQDTKVP